MKVKITKIDGKKDYEKEVVWLEVYESCDIGKYTLADSTYTKEGKISNTLRNTYWIPDKSVKKGDVVKIFTKKGVDSEVDNGNGTKTHLFYWGMAKAVWNNDGDCAVLFEHNTWQFKDMK